MRVAVRGLSPLFRSARGVVARGSLTSARFAHTTPAAFCASPTTTPQWCDMGSEGEEKAPAGFRKWRFGVIWNGTQPLHVFWCVP